MQVGTVEFNRCRSGHAMDASGDHRSQIRPKKKLNYLVPSLFVCAEEWFSRSNRRLTSIDRFRGVAIILRSFRLAEGNLKSQSPSEEFIKIVRTGTLICKSFSGNSIDV